MTIRPDTVIHDTKGTAVEQFQALRSYIALSTEALETFRNELQESVQDKSQLNYKDGTYNKQDSFIERANRAVGGLQGNISFVDEENIGAELQECVSECLEIDFSSLHNAANTLKEHLDANMTEPTELVESLGTLTALFTTIEKQLERLDGFDMTPPTPSKLVACTARPGPAG